MSSGAILTFLPRLPLLQVQEYSNAIFTYWSCGEDFGLLASSGRGEGAGDGESVASVGGLGGGVAEEEGQTGAGGVRLKARSADSV